MPRQIIDTESSRPAYVRRNILRAVGVVIVAIVLAVLVFALLHRHAGVAAGTVFVALAPGNPFSGRVSWDARPRTPFQEKPCCDA
jgi:hypothetical protein